MTKFLDLPLKITITTTIIMITVIIMMIIVIVIMNEAIIAGKRSPIR